jgi:hypothetical protein
VRTRVKTQGRTVHTSAESVAKYEKLFLEEISDALDLVVLR